MVFNVPIAGPRSSSWTEWSDPKWRLSELYVCSGDQRVVSILDQPLRSFRGDTIFSKVGGLRLIWRVEDEGALRGGRSLERKVDRGARRQRLLETL